MAGGFKSQFLSTLCERGYLHQCTDIPELDGLMSAGMVTAYVGFDCTARSLHIGSLMQIMVIRYLQRFGHRVLVLLGGATTKVGDPSGRDKARAILSEDDILANKEGILKVIRKFLPSDERVLVVDNSEWLEGVRYLEFLRDVGSKFSVNVMLNLESVKNRLNRDQNLSFLEFNYALLQSYDFVELHRRYGCVLQIGGSDQWGNIVSGIDLGRKLGISKLYGLTTPLLLTGSGEKMGKTSGGAIWLDAEMCSPCSYWQYFRNVPDEKVSSLLRLFTELPISEVEELGNLQGEEINEAKKVLATEATSICHGREVALSVAHSALQVFEHGNDDELPSFVLSSNDLNESITVAKLLYISGLEESIGAGRRLIRGKGCKINGVAVENVDHVLSRVDFSNSGGYIRVCCGKKRRLKVILEG